MAFADRVQHGLLRPLVSLGRPSNSVGLKDLLEKLIVVGRGCRGLVLGVLRGRVAVRVRLLCGEVLLQVRLDLRRGLLERPRGLGGRRWALNAIPTALSPTASSTMTPVASPTSMEGTSVRHFGL